MKIQRELVPFRPAYEGRSIHAEVGLTGRLLSVEYTIHAGMSPLRIPPRSPRPARRDNLWRTTCCELFLSHRRYQQYFEFNFSPSYDWNAYFFTSYRHEMRESQRVPKIDWMKVTEKGPLTVFSIGVNTARLGLEPKHMKLGLSTVLEDANGDISHWALNHPDFEPNFHDRKGWTLNLWEELGFSDEDDFVGPFTAE